MSTVEKTGPAPGKITPSFYEVVLCDEGGCMDIESVVYIHLEGYADARITHVDIEEGDWSLIQEAFEVSDKVGVEILSGEGFLVAYRDGVELAIFWDIVLPEVTCNGIMGVKDGGVYLGLCGEIIGHLEREMSISGGGSGDNGGG